MPPAPQLDLEHHFADINGIRMHYVAAGSGETVLFVHGFPESWYSWRHQLAHFSKDYRVVAPDLRGYNESENRGPYDTGTLQEDVLALIRHLGVERVQLVAHDWGAAIAWLLGMHHPEVLQTLTICNVPHPELMRKGILKPRQLLRSWYIFFFQVPRLPEAVLARDGYRGLARQIIRDTRPGTFTRDDVKQMLAAWRRQGLNGGINWYRALRRAPKVHRPVPTILVPTLLIWGEDDIALGKELTYGTEEYVRDLTVHYLPNTSHWVQQEEPEKVNQLLAAHLERSSAGAGA